MPFCRCTRFWRRRAVIATAALALAFSLLASGGDRAEAAENGKGFYLLGSKTTTAGFIPPPGTYGTDYNFFYSGDACCTAADGVALNDLGNITLQADIGVDAQIYIKILSVLKVTETKIFGGNFGYGILVPIGSQDISVDLDALATLTLANGTTVQIARHFSFDDDTFAFGDPVLMSLLGWHSGNWHWNVTGFLNVPIGSYDKNDIANMGFNRWGFDSTFSATWLDPQRGLEVSGAVGATFNGENSDTNYETGTELHAEYAVMKILSKAFSIGVAGYNYNQVTDDSGRGATLGSFKGQTNAIGPNINYNFQFGNTPVSTTFRWFHEYDVKNRLKGDAFYINATIPLGGPRRQ